MENKLKVGKKTSVDKYEIWIKENESGIKKTSRLEYRPLISIIVPVYNVIDEQLEECIRSVLKQTYDNWELCLVDDASTWKNVRKTLAKYEKKKNVHVIYRKENGHISAATNSGIEVASGEFLAFLDCDDVLAPNAIYEVTKKLNENRNYDFIYSDEDKLTEDGKKRHSPFFKPDWSPDTFMSLMYTCHFGVYRKSIANQIGNLKVGLEGAQDYDFTLRFTELTNKIGHIAKILYHWRERKESTAVNPESKPYAVRISERVKKEALDRRNLEGDIVYVKDMYQYRVNYINSKNPKISIVIPSKDNFHILKKCIDSITDLTEYPDYEIIVIDNGSNEENRETISEYTSRKNVIYHYEKMDFNFSRMCNIGANKANGKFILFLNDDIENIQADWLHIMVGHASLSHVGAVGAKLLYPESTLIQHAGITNLKIGPSHSFLGFDDRNSYYYGRNRMDYNCIAVTGACLMINKKKFEEAGGFDESFHVGYNDIDLCFRLVEKGYFNVIRNDVILYHHESASRGSDEQNDDKMDRLRIEFERLYSKNPIFLGKDPFYNVNLIQGNVDFDININNQELYSKKKSVDHSTLFHIEQNNVIAGIDRVSTLSNIHISGWICAPYEKRNDRLRKEVILIGSHGECYSIKPKDVYRSDVQKEFPEIPYLGNSGFECTISKEEMDLNTVSYRIGVIVRNSFGKVVGGCLTDKMIGKVTESEKLTLQECRLFKTDIREKSSVDGILYSIDQIVVKDSIVIRGWFADTVSDIHKRSSVKILLKDSKGRIYIVNTKTEYRPDLVNALPAMKTPVNTGFGCNFFPLNEMHGIYTLGLFWDSGAGKKSGYIMTDKVITIGE